jgi:hypothetical protein
MEKTAMSFRGIACGAAVVLALSAGQASAAWNNAFQVTCFGWKNRASHYQAPAPAPAPIVAYSAPADPCSCCQTCFVQRCYYQPVTTFKKVLEPVQQQRTSYFWEPVCTQRTSCYIDPCTGCPIQVTRPEVSYRLRSKCDTVTCYVERCVPVTTYRIAHRLEAVTVCPPGVTAPSGAGGGIGAPPINGVNPNYIPNPQVPMAEPGRVTETPASPGSLKRPSAIRMDKVTGREHDGAVVQGQVVAKNYVTPVRGAKVLFVSKESEKTKLDATADPTGRFAVNLPAGGWRIYLSSRDGSLEYHSSIDVQDAQNRNVMVVSR